MMHYVLRLTATFCDAVISAPDNTLHCLRENVDLWTLRSGISTKFGFTGQNFLIEKRQRLMCFVNQSDNLLCYYSVVNHRANPYLSCFLLELFTLYIVRIYYGFSFKQGKDWSTL